MSRYLLQRGRGLLGGLAVLAGGGSVYDYHLGDQKITRNVRTLYVAWQTLLDYKLRLTAENLDEIHTRVAKRVLNLCQQNGGLYIKLGQGISSMNHILPPQYNQIFSVLHDKAPSVSYHEVEKIFQEEFGKKPEEMFSHFEKEPIASASIAQVHKATLADGTPVAVKVQKPYIRRQMPFDLFTFRFVVYWFEKLFDLPMYWTVDYTQENLWKETDFVIEAANAERAAQHLKNVKGVYVPKVHHDQTSPRILTTEWIDGVKISEPAKIEAMGLSVPAVVQTMVEAFGYQIFISGFVHCDPHPGNILVRKQKDGHHEVVLLDHGLYIEEPEKFRQEYCHLWKAMFLLDVDSLKQICESWGVRDHELFASLQLFKPYNPEKAVQVASIQKEDMLEMQRKMKEKIRHLLIDTSLVPQELIFIGRNMNLVRANNKHLKSPVNRVNILVEYASQGSIDSTNGVVSRLIERFKFRSQLFLVNLFYLSTQLWHRVGLMLGLKAAAFEDVLERGLAQTLEEKLGLTLNVSESGFD
eukprot:comp12773_c0_seq1/m.7900 comp12773_c0_seq1/g.7900  ORF comp12773_c0_seq1/g.7900 comp12773_c0_seq1/m.7900 type:complete len:526 (-) comp12773_c0_seq1:114-1691(-)